eukprot:6953553-Prymnesium_polylepis.2
MSDASTPRPRPLLLERSRPLHRLIRYGMRTSSGTVALWLSRLCACARGRGAFPLRRGGYPGATFP